MKRVLISSLMVLILLSALSSLAFADTRPSPGPWPEFSLMTSPDSL